MTEFAVLVFAILIASVTFSVFIPWAGRLQALYMAHDLRDRIYSVGEKHPSIRETLIYRDAEFVSCAVIACLRIGGRAGHQRARWFVHALWSYSPSDQHYENWRRTRYEYECEATFKSLPGAEGMEALTALADAVRQTEFCLMLRGATGSPAALAICFVLAPIYAAREAFSAAKSPLAVAAEAVERLDKHVSAQGHSVMPTAA